MHGRTGEFSRKREPQVLVAGERNGTVMPCKASTPNVEMFETFRKCVKNCEHLLPASYELVSEFIVFFSS